MTNSARPVIDYISQHTIISEEELNAMMECMHFASYKKNELLQQQGEIQKQIAFITKGAVRSYYLDPKGVEQTTGFTFENNPIINLDSFLSEIPLAINTVALEPTELIWTSHKEFSEIINEFPKYKLALLTVLSNFMEIEGQQTKLLRIISSRDRYDALCKMRPEVIQRVSIKHIASYLRMADETLSRLRSGNL